MARQVIAFFTAFAVLLAGPLPAGAQDWPAKPVKLVNGYPAGGGADILARVLAQRVGESLGQQFITENRAGAGGMIGQSAVAAAATPNCRASGRAISHAWLKPRSARRLSNSSRSLSG